MRFNRPLPETQALSQATALTSPAVPVATNGRAQALALEKAATELGTTPYWLRRRLRQRGLAVTALVEALKQERAALEETARALRAANNGPHEAMRERHRAEQQQVAQRPRRPRTWRANGGGTAAAPTAPVLKARSSRASQQREHAHV